VPAYSAVPTAGTGREPKHTTATATSPPSEVKLQLTISDEFQEACRMSNEHLMQDAAQRVGRVAQQEMKKLVVTPSVADSVSQMLHIGVVGDWPKQPVVLGRCLESEPSHGVRSKEPYALFDSPKPSHRYMDVSSNPLFAPATHAI